MSTYNKDRSFTDFVHHKLAIPYLYKLINWHIKLISKDSLELKDINEGIDYVFVDVLGKEINVQERFRDAYYSGYNDATIRYRRAKNLKKERVESEFYKIKADYLVYGITNGKKFYNKRYTVTDFIKWVILDIKFIQQKFKEGKIKIVNSKAVKCWVENDILVCPENFNTDSSSSFIPLDIKLIYKLWGMAPIFAQKGFL